MGGLLGIATMNAGYLRCLPLQCTEKGVGVYVKEQCLLVSVSPGLGLGIENFGIFQMSKNRGFDTMRTF